MTVEQATELGKVCKSVHGTQQHMLKIQVLISD
jgi:hypothetical protein